MEKTESTTVGARKLIKTIFQKEASKRLVKGLRDSVDIFQKFLRRHKSCPMKMLLDKFCKADGTLSESGEIKDVPYPQVIFDSVGSHCNWIPLDSLAKVSKITQTSSSKFNLVNFWYEERRHLE